MRSIGAVYDETAAQNFLYLAGLPREYDAVIYFEETTPSRLLPFVR
jgi:hypothetical protein